MSRLAIGLMLLAFCLPARAEEGATERTPIEEARRPPGKPQALGTKSYEPSEAERPFFEALPEAARVTGGGSDVYKLQGRADEAVSWFGIVRKLEIDPVANRTDLLVEMKYFDGRTDTHIQLVSFHGSGDFRARLRGTDLPIRLLSLVRIYGKVTGETDEVPEVEATFVRQWDWGHFTLMAYGPDAGNPKWRSLVRVSADDAYRTFPGKRYYDLRLGSRKTIKLHHRLGEKVFVALGKDLAARFRKNKALLANTDFTIAMRAAVKDGLMAHGLTRYLSRKADGPYGYAGPDPMGLAKEFDLKPETCRSALADFEAAVEALHLPEEAAAELLKRVRKSVEPVLGDR